MNTTCLHYFRSVHESLHNDLYIDNQKKYFELLVQISNYLISSTVKVFGRVWIDRIIYNAFNSCLN